ncbi:MAG: FAD-binding oxidoreductase, partial [Anaerolineae bacterium]|nr:FAD-binding oxidoreductase [Anaerolineae bacterium]
MPTTLFNRFMLGASQLAAAAWPIAGRLFPEKLEIDANQSVWTTETPDYLPGAPLTKTISADLAIIGGGFTGTSTAYHFSRRYPEKRVVLLEAKTLANGASGRNGGMLLNGLTDPLSYATPEMVKRVYETTCAGMDDMLAVIQRHNLTVSHRMDGTVTIYTDTERAETAHAEVEQQRQLGIPVEFIDAATLAQKLNLQGAKGAVLDPHSGQINGAQLVRGLRPVLLERGVEIYEGTPVLKIREGSEIVLTTPNGEVRAKAIVIATNGYTGKLGYFRDALFPLHSHIYATAPLTPEQQRELGWGQVAGFSDDMDRISYGALTTDGTIVFGGGSNQSYAYLFNNRTAYPGSAPRAFAAMQDTLAGYLPNSRALPIAQRWTGTLGITLNRQLLMGVRGDDRNIFYSIGYCGHGVTLGNLAGKVLTDLY